MPDVPIRDKVIRLGQFLKLAGAVDSGSDVKRLLAEDAVTVNGESESRRGRQLVSGDVVTYGGETFQVVGQGDQDDSVSDESRTSSS